MELVEVVSTLPTEVWGVVVLVVGLGTATIGVRWMRRRSSQRDVPDLHRTPDPVLVGREGKPGLNLSHVDFDSQQTLIPAAFVVKSGPEEIDLLSPDGDRHPLPVERPDDAVLAAAKRTVAAAVDRQGGPGATDNLTQIRGLSPVHARALHRHGIRSFAQLGQLDSEEVKAVATLLSCPVDQIESDDWVGQARTHAEPR